MGGDTIFNMSSTSRTNSNSWRVFTQVCWRCLLLTLHQMSVSLREVTYHKSCDFNKLLLIFFFSFLFCFSTQGRLSDHNTRSGAEAPESALHKWPSVRYFVPGLLGGVGQTRLAVPCVPVSVRRFPHYGRPPPQRPTGGPRSVGRWSHTPQLSLLGVQCFGLILSFSVLLFLGQGEFLLLPSVLYDAGSFFYLGLFPCVPVATESFSKRGPPKTGWGSDAQRVSIIKALQKHWTTWLSCFKTVFSCFLSHVPGWVLAKLHTPIRKNLSLLDSTSSSSPNRETSCGLFQWTLSR